MLNAVDTLGVLRGKKERDSALEGLHVLQATSVEPNPINFKLIGTELNLDAGMFDIPVSVYPICKGDEFLAYPIVGEEHQRWGIVAKLTGSGKTGTMKDSESCKVDGVAITYSGSQIIPPKSAVAGDRVAVIPFGTRDNVRYALVPIDYRVYTECENYGEDN